MSTETLSDDEHASFLVGEAVRRLLENPKATAAQHKLIWAAYVRAVELELTDFERSRVIRATGCATRNWLFAPATWADEAEDEIRKVEDENPDDDFDPEIPF